METKAQQQTCETRRIEQKTYLRGYDAAACCYAGVSDVLWFRCSPVSDWMAICKFVNLRAAGQTTLRTMSKPPS